MRPQIVLRAAPAVAAAAGALGIATIPAAGAPVAAAVSTDPGAPVQLSVEDRHLRYGQAVVVVGRLASGQPGADVRLQHLAAGASTWTPLAGATTGPDGRFELRAKVRRSGALRVVESAVATAASADPAAAAATAQSSVRVGARLVTRSVRRHVSAGRAVRVGGALKPGGAGRTVSLQLRGARGWRTVDRDRTDAAGRYRLAQRLGAATSSRARVRFAGDAANARSVRPLGRVAAFRSASASWYGPGLYGNPLGCGGTLAPGTVGVAHKTLPCGTKLTLRYRGNVVQARVIDRGPFVAGREFDLTAATKAKLGFGSTGTIQVAQ